MEIVIRTKEELEVLIKELNDQIARFTMGVEYENALVAFRETYIAWYDERITLDECLAQMMANMKLCNDIGVWRNRK